MFFNFNIVALASLAASISSAHMIMNTPKPYGNPDNGPLKLDGSDFPCKSVPYDADFETNVYRAGGEGKLAFTGSVVHGGGSCQVSLTKDLQPNKDSVWKVIKSIHGGCPKAGVPGNLTPEDANGHGADQFTFAIPKKVPAGKYSLAWTWFNKVGNREMYMNCAPVTISGNEGSEAFYNDLPNMFKANIFGGEPAAGGTCRTPADTDLIFPNPGKDVQEINPVRGNAPTDCPM